MKKLIFLFVVILISCGSSSQFSKFTENDKLMSNRSRIYIIRPISDAGLWKCRVTSNGVLVGKNGAKGYICWDVDEGEQVIRSYSVYTDDFVINAKAGKTYYIKQTPIMMGWMLHSILYEQIGEDEGKSFIDNLKKPKLKYTE
jgi:hypothetical protein